MSRIAFVNGQFVPHNEAVVHIEDRGYQFADGVYEVCEIRDNQVIDLDGHLKRLQYSLSELQMNMPMNEFALAVKMKQTVKLNRVKDGLIYLQVTRGVSPRNHAFPPSHVKSSIVLTAKSVSPTSKKSYYENGVAVISVPENRWARPDIKTIGLLPNCMAKQEAKEQGAFEAWFVDDDGLVVEGSSSNAWIINQDNEIITKSADGSILKGITRAAILRQIEAHNLTVVERPFSLREAILAKEAFISSATTIVLPVVKIDNHLVAGGKVGEIAKNLFKEFYDFAQKTNI